MPALLTPNYSLIKPDPNDPIDVTQLNQNMDILDANINQGVLVATTPPDTALLTSYVNGMSMFRLTSTDIALYPGWAVDPGSQSAVVVTFKPNADRMVQLWYRGSATTQAAYYRYGTATGNFTWTKIGGADAISVYSASNAGVLSSWGKGTVGTTEWQQGVDVIASGGGVTLKSGGVYQLEGYIQWDGAASSAGTKYAGLDDSTGASPNVWYRNTVYGDNNQSVTQCFNITRQFPANTNIALWLNVSNATGCNTSLRRITARRVNS